MKILRKLTLKNLRLNRTRTIVTIVGILLSAALITVVAGVATSGQQTMINSSIINSGNYDFILYGNFDDNSVRQISANRNIENVYKCNPVGVAEFDSKSTYRPYVYIEGFSKNAFENCFECSLQNGRYPESTDELVLSPLFTKYSKKQYKVGDSITLTVGSRQRLDSDATESDDDETDTLAAVEEYRFEKEKFVGEFTKKYKIVGILNDVKGEMESDSQSASVKIYTMADFTSNAQRAKGLYESVMYADITESKESEYINVISEIIGTTPEVTEKILDKNEALDKSPIHINDFDINKDVLACKGYALSDKNMKIIYGLIAFIITIIIISSVFIIRNSFAISITEKTKLYGMLSSTGATPRQIRHNVLYEGFLLGLVGIPLGIGLGVGVTAVLIALCNTILSESLNGLVIVYKISWIAIVAAVVLSVVTILFSTLSSALRASHISPIEAIRSNNDIKIKQKTKHYKTPKLITKLFGIGGSIAWKNLKRSRKKYRTTVASIVVSVAVFISIYSFVSYGVKYSENYYTNIKYNLYISLMNNSDTKSNIDKNIELFNKIKAMDGVEKSLTRYVNYDYIFEINWDNIPENMRNESNESLIIDNDESYAAFSPTIIAVDDAAYKDIIKTLGYNYDDVKDKGIINNNNVLIDENGYHTDKTYRLFKKTIGTTLKGTIGIDEDEYSYDEKYKDVTIEIGGEFTDTKALDEYSETGIDEYGTIIVNKSWFDKHINPLDTNLYLYINSTDPDKIEQSISDMDNDNISVWNHSRNAREMNSLILIMQIFVYGFILVISLIGITNIFNTITTNMRLRQKEFAMLRSIGMTNREFKRMIRLESIFYTSKSLIIGIPLGILGGFIISKIFKRSEEMSYIFPWLAILISIIAVLLIVWMIMRFSIGKVKNQNIIETIRNDNI